MNRIELAQYMIEEFLNMHNEIVVAVENIRIPHSADIVLESGKRIGVNGLLAYELSVAK